MQDKKGLHKRIEKKFFARLYSIADGLPDAQ